MARQMIKGISMCNPVDFDREYLLYTADYAIQHHFDHFQMIGPTHNTHRGNVDGLIAYRKYAQFNGDKDYAYLKEVNAMVNEVCEKLYPHGIKTFFWHHELELPEDFGKVYPEILNDYGDVEITHPLVKDFLVNKIEDFFAAYPKMDGLILTLHETRIPLLKLKNQKLGKIERVKYVTETLYNACKALGKELIVRPFASIEEDYQMMTDAYEQISRDLVIMDKWTQFDWSLTLPDNKFFNKIKNNPLFVETDIFGEYFGKGFLPLMLKDHICRKFRYCEGYSPVGYVSRIDREGFHPFDSVNEVNLHIMEACLCGYDVDETVKNFFESAYPGAGKEILSIMEDTEEIQKKIFYLDGYYFTELSRFPRLNHSKNHFYFEMMKEDYQIASNEWFIPIGWKRCSLEEVRKEKADAVAMTEQQLKKLAATKDKLTEKAYAALEEKFLNLAYIAKLWQALTDAFISYAKYFETKDESYETALFDAFEKMRAVNAEGIARLGNIFYPVAINPGDPVQGNPEKSDRIELFVEQTAKCFALEKAATDAMEKENLTDFIVCGGAMESHKLQKEVNFSDTFVFDDGICRIPGTNRGKIFSAVNAHGWFSYEIAVRPNAENTVVIEAKGSEGNLDYTVTVNEEKTTFREKAEGKTQLVLSFKETEGKTTARIRFDRISGYTPYFYTVKVM